MGKSVVDDNIKYFDSKFGERKGSKTGGIHKSDPSGGIYQTKDDTYLIKRDVSKSQNDVAEYLSAKIFEETAKNSGAEIELARLNSNAPNPTNNQNAFLVSKYFKNGYQDFYKEAKYNDRPSKLEAIQSKLMSRNYVNRKLAEKDAKGQYKYQDYEKIMASSLLVGDFSVHSGNIGVLTQDNNKLVRIDFGAAFRDFSSEVKPFASIKNRIGAEKNYFLRDHPKERIVNRAFSKELRNIANKDLNSTIDQAWQQIETNFKAENVKKGENTIYSFAKQIGADEVDPKDFLKNRLKERQQSLKNFANEIDLQLAVREKDQNKILDVIKKAEEESPGHFAKIFNDPSKSDLGTKFSSNEIKQMSAVLDSLKPSVERAQDSVSFNSPSAEKLNINTSISEQINDKQKEALHDTLKDIDENAKKFGAAAFLQYLQAPENKVHIDKALNSELFKQRINEISRNDYQKLHSQYKDSLKPIDWDSPSPQKGERVQILKNDNGQILCTLTETSVEAKGNPVGVASYRKIDFPMNLDQGAQGPLYVAMALKDEKGKNMPARDALYFTANYDENGKLTNMSSPVPVKFMGKGGDAIGYIEANGQKYTLPVTRSKYEQMAKEIGLDKNIGIATKIEVKDNSLEKNDIKIDTHRQSPSSDKTNNLEKLTSPSVPSGPKPALKRQKNIDSNNKNIMSPPSTPQTNTWVKGSKNQGRS